MDKLKYMIEKNKVATIIGLIIFAIVFLIFLLLTINAFTGGKLFGDKETYIYIGENSYGKMYYSGEILNGKLSGSGTLDIKGDKLKISLDGIFANDVFKSGIVNITDYNNKYNSILLGTFDEDKIIEGTLRYEDSNENIGIYEGNFINGELDGSGSAYYLLTPQNKAVMKSGNFANGKLITVLENIETELIKEDG